MDKIVKVIYEDGTHLERANFKYGEFEDEILGDLDPDNVKDYAKEQFDLVDEDDVEETTLEDFDDYEIMQEASERGLIGKGDTILTEDFVQRFLAIVELENPIFIDNLLMTFEKKYGL